MLTSLQQRAVHIFFDLPESEGFALVGGAALLAHGVGTRPTQDLDLFTEPPVDVGALAEMIGMFERHPRAEYLIDDAGFSAMEEFYKGWRARLIDQSLG
jgi:hypothetical protein